MTTTINASTVSGLVNSADTSGILQLQTASTAALTIDASQRVGIGTTAPNKPLSVYGGDGYVQMLNASTGTGNTDGAFIGVEGGTTALRVVNQENDVISFSTNGLANERMRIDSSGRVGIGTTTTSNATLTVNNTDLTSPLYIGSQSDSSSWGGFFVNGATSSTAGNGIYGKSGASFYYNVASGLNHIWTVNGGGVMRIDSSGNLLVNTTSQFAKITVVNGGGDVIGAQTLVNNGYSNFIGKNLSGTNTFVVSGGGSVTKTSGTFRIEHPIPEKAVTHDLVHSFIEGPNADLIYRGKITLIAGKAQVNIDTEARMTDGTFVLLCRNVQCFTTNETDWTAVKGSVIGNILTIESQEPESTAEISWMVIGERQDKHMFETGWTDENGKPITEPLKNQRNLDVEI